MKIKIYLVVLFLIGYQFKSLAQEQKMSESEITVFKQADSVEYKHLDFLSKDIETSGKMVFKEPNSLLWQYKKPYNYSIVFKNGKISINDEGKKSAVDMGNSKLFTKINKLIVGIVSINLFENKKFYISYYKNKDQNVAKFTPKDVTLKKYIKQIELTF